MSLSEVQGLRRRRIYVDALALVAERKSGIGYNLEQTLNSVLSLPDIKKHYTIYLVVPLGKAKYLKSIYTKMCT